MNKYISFAIVCLIVCLSSCNNNHSEVIKVVSERDSLQNVADAQTRRLNKIANILRTLDSALDSIQHEEGMIFVNAGGEMASRTDALENLTRFETVVKHQQDRINELEAKLKAQDEEDDPRAHALEAASLIANLKSQLAAKDRQIAELRTELEKKNVDISRLRAKVQEQQEQIADLDNKNQRYTTALKRQDEVINSGYVIIGSKKELEAKGVLYKGKLRTSNVLNRDLFKKVDIRKFTEITFTAKKPKIITYAPATTYELTTNGAGTFTLHITNVTQFWSVSNYLVIQTQ